MKKRHTLRTVGGLLASAAWVVSAAAETKVAQQIEVGLQSVDLSNPEAKFREYKDVPQGLVIENYKMDVEAPNYDMTLDANKLTQEDQSAELSYNRRGKLWFNAGYDQTPHRWSDTSRTIYNETNPGIFKLPDTLQSYFQTNSGTTSWWTNMPSNLEGSHTQELVVRGDKASLNLGGALTDAVNVNFNFSQEKKNGNQLTPIALGRGHFTELARTVDQTVYDSGVAVDYASKGMELGFSYGLNLYENDIETLVWDNAKKLTDDFTARTAPATPSTTLGDDSAQGRSSLQPDNLAHNARISAGLDLPGRTRFNSDISYTRMEQNQQLLPYTINTAMNASTNTVGFNAFDSAELPSQSADTLQTLWVQGYQVANRLFKNVAFGVKARSEQLGNDSKEINFTGHTTLDQGWSGTDEETVRFAYRKLALGAFADWDILRSLTAGLDYTQETVNRTHREYKETDESTWIGRLNYSPLSWMKIRGRYTRADRDAKDFEVEDYMNSTATSFAENPGLRRYDIAARLRNAGDLQVQAWRGPLTATLSGGLGHDKYKPGDGNLYSDLATISTTNQDKQYGLLENRLANAAVDLGLDLSERLGLSAFYQCGLVEGVQRQNQNTGSSVAQNAADDYTLNTTDRYDTVGVGVDSSVTSKTNVHLGYDLAYSRGAMDYSNLGSAVTTKKSVPETVTSKQDYTIKGEYKASQSVSLSLGYLFEIYNVKDFAQDNVPLASGQAAGQTNIMLGDSSLDYKAHVVTLMAKYKW